VRKNKWNSLIITNLLVIMATTKKREQVFLSIFIGDVDKYQSECEAFSKLETFLASKGSTYGLPSCAKNLTDEHKEVVQSLHESVPELKNLVRYVCFCGRVVLINRIW
jgi:hypothetical protein